MSGRVIAAIVAAACLVAGSTALAHNVTYVSFVDVFDYTGPNGDETAHVRVDADVAVCERNRTVKYFIYFPSTGFERQGSAETNDNGVVRFRHLDYRQHHEDATGDKAKVLKRVTRRGDHRHECTAGEDVNG
jgi:hypothetical protein